MCLHILNMSVIIILQWFQDSYILSYRQACLDATRVQGEGGKMHL